MSQPVQRRELAPLLLVATLLSSGFTAAAVLAVQRFAPAPRAARADPSTLPSAVSPLPPLATNAPPAAPSAWVPPPGFKPIGGGLYQDPRSGAVSRDPSTDPAIKQMDQDLAAEVRWVRTKILPCGHRGAGYMPFPPTYYTCTEGHRFVVREGVFAPYDGPDGIRIYGGSR